MKQRDDLAPFLFEGKNTGYGSYVLRKDHDRNLLLGLLAGILLIGGILIYPVLARRFKSEAPDTKTINVNYTRVINYSELSAPPPIEAIQEQPQTKPTPAEAVKFVKPVVKKDEEVQEEELIPTAEELKTTNIGYEYVEGNDSIAYEPSDVEVSLPKPVVAEPVKEEPFRIVEQMPEYIGGESSMFGYLKENLRYPDLARTAGIQGIVYVQFVVNASGKVENVELVRGIGGGCDEEALRVVRSMGNWTPGEQNGRRVPVRMVIPIRFTLLE